MKNIALITFMAISICLSSCVKQADNKSLTNTKTDTTVMQLDKSFIDSLKSYKDKYPHNVSLLDNPKLQTRLIRLLGSDKFQYLKKTWATESPIEIKGDYFIAAACQAHNCAATNFIVIVNLKNEKLYVGIRIESKPEIFGDDDARPTELSEWFNQK
jgi:hypothetical protein